MCAVFVDRPTKPPPLLLPPSPRYTGGLGLISWSNRRPLKSFLTVSVWASVVGWSLSLSPSSLSSSALASSDWWWHSCGFILIRLLPLRHWVIISKLGIILSRIYKQSTRHRHGLSIKLRRLSEGDQMNSPSIAARSRSGGALIDLTSIDWP